MIAFGSGGTTENTTTNSNSKNETVTDAKKEDKDSTPVKKVEAVEVTGDLLTTPALRLKLILPIWLIRLP